MSLVTRIKGKKSEKNRRQIKKGSEVERKASKKGPVKCSCKCVASMFVNRPLLTHTDVQKGLYTYIFVCVYACASRLAHCPHFHVSMYCCAAV